MKTALLERRGEPLRITEVDDPSPGQGEVLLRVEACGVCHGDVCIADGAWDWVALPRIIGHEIVGVVEEVGPGVDEECVGLRFGVGWMYRSCGRCESCRSRAQMLCEARLVTGSDVNGGYAAKVVAPRDRLVQIPDALGPVEAAPLMCAGVSAFNGLRKAGFGPGTRVGVVGIGGLGHLAVQFAKAAGSRVVAVSRTRRKEKDALTLGADEFVATAEGDLAEQLTSLGGLDVAVITATDASLLGSVVGGMRPNGALVMLGLDNDITLSPADLCLRQLRVYGSLTGTVDDEADTLRVAAETGIRPWVEEYPLDQANVALERVRSGEVRYRAALVP
ncbi:alcohol dehydrogenase [Carbonactinospora thermoautotrophica]|uniref:alcohol dehydrogenase catalytic domain-containing protein n=1 Tax=Carbonactinospora thermoautotrophica TaxID=1469144 RepID=UPI00227082BA|nr:alcohol dehydrogenase catalytic domain-containing protein [Carbonactinospora thermoautotrophica]MCX9191551.1 alcohol dehydrogenase [Carbonactinospora thermoautotrophica]